MKKTFVILLAFLWVSAAGHAQGFFFRAGLGYALPMAGQSIDGSGTPISGSRTTSTYQQPFKVDNASFAAGMQGAIGFGYMFSPNAGVQLDVHVGLQAKKYTFKDNNVLIDFGQGAIPRNITTIQQADMPVMIAPQLVLKTNGPKINVYSRFGMVVPLMTDVLQDSYVENAPGTGSKTTYLFSSRLKSRFSLGFTAAAGAQYRVNSRLNIFAEVSILSLSTYLKQSNLEGFAINGQPLSVSNVSPQTITYTKNGVLDTNGTTQASYSLPFSNVGFNVGVSVSLGKGSRKTNQRGDTREAATPDDDNRNMGKRPKSGRFK